MAITNERFEALLRKLGCAFEFDATRRWFCLAFPTQIYRDRAGHPRVTVIIKLEEDGEFVRFLAPAVYDLSSGPFRAQACEAAMQIAWTTKALAFELESGTGHLWAVIEFPIADNSMTERQVKSCLLLLVDLLDDYHAVMRNAIDTGTIDFALTGRAVPQQPAPTEAERLIAEMGGIERVKAIVSSLPSA